jgi:histidinol-phosphatase (PHP family)
VFLSDRDFHLLLVRNLRRTLFAPSALPSRPYDFFACPVPVPVRRKITFMNAVRTDYHIHTTLCHHAVGAPIEYVQAARSAGLTEIGFADHNPMPEQFDAWRMSIEDLPRYLEMVEGARSTGFPIRLGLECDFVDGYESWIEKLAGMAPWDYLIGSVHYIAPGWDVDNPKYLTRFRQYPVEEIWALYWKHYVRCIESGLFDFVAHPDLAKKFGYRPPGDLRRYYDPAIEALAKKNVAFEINTAGLRKEVEEIYPAPRFIEMAKQAGVSMLINSDAHAPEEVAYGFGPARDLARAAGYAKVCIFEKRQRIEVDL